MNLNQLYYFRAIAKLEHYRLAAEKLNVSQPSLSSAILNLEEELGTTLFEKSGRNIKLTENGKIFLKYVESSIEILEEGVNKIKKINKGVIKIAYIFPLSTTYIPKLVREYLEINQAFDINFTLKQDLTVDIISKIKKSEYDIGFCSKLENEPTLNFIPLIEQKLVLIVPQNHRLANRKSISIKEIDNCELVSYFKESGLGQFLTALFNHHKISPKIKFEAENEQGIIGLVSQNFGISLVGKTSLLDNTDLIQIDIEDLELKRYIYLVYLKNKTLQPHIKEFLEYVKKKKDFKIF